MSPHQKMKELDAAGTEYLIQLGASRQGHDVFSHSEEWLELNCVDPCTPGQREWVNLRHIATLRIIEL